MVFTPPSVPPSSGDRNLFRGGTRYQQAQVLVPPLERGGQVGSTLASDTTESGWDYY